MRTIYFNGAVYTGTLPLAEAFIVEDGKFTFVGSGSDALAQRRESDQIADLAGAFVCAGFNDSHMHLLNYGQTLRMAPLAAHTGSLGELLCCLKDFLDTNSPSQGQWILGRGWNQDYFTDVKRMPNRWDLDTVSTDVPICAVRACGHALVLNSRAMELVGITGDTPQPDGGQIVLENGIPHGVFFDTALDAVYDAIPVPDKDALKSMILAACKALNAYGVTSCQSDDYCVFRSVPWKQVNEAYQEQEQSGALTVRIYEQCNFTDLPSLKAFVEAGNVTGTGTGLFKIGPLKMLGDGALGARTAFLSRPYADDPTTRGIPVFSQAAFDEMIGYAIGDACLDRVLSSLEKALDAHPKEEHRHGIVHCQITRADQLEKLSRMKLHIYAQSIFLDYDIHIVEQRVGAELAGTSYSWKTLMEKGTTVSNGTDCPVEPPKALAGIQCAVTRTTLRDHLGPYLPREKLTVREALDSYTSAGAYASFEESLKGRIQPGMLADFVILGKNPFTAEEHTIQDIPVLATYLGGRKVF